MQALGGGGGVCCIPLCWGEYVLRGVNVAMRRAAVFWLFSRLCGPAREAHSRLPDSLGSSVMRTHKPTHPLYPPRTRTRTRTQVMLDAQGHPLLIRKRQHYTQIWENEVPLPGNAHL